MSDYNLSNVFDRCGRNQAQFCRDMGFVVGDRFVGDDCRTTTLIEITAIGRREVLFCKVAVILAGQRTWRSKGGEGFFALRFRDWRKVARAYPAESNELRELVRSAQHHIRREWPQANEWLERAFKALGRDAALSGGGRLTFFACGTTEDERLDLLARSQDAELAEPTEAIDRAERLSGPCDVCREVGGLLRISGGDALCEACVAADDADMGWSRVIGDDGYALLHVTNPDYANHPGLDDMGWA